MTDQIHCEDCEGYEVDISELENQVTDLKDQIASLESDIEEKNTQIRTIYDYLTDAENTALDTVSSIQAAMREV